MHYLIILIFILTFAFFGNELGYTAPFPLYKHLTFNFQHANLIHLILNSVAFLSMYKVLRPHLVSCYLILVSLSISTICSFLPFCYYHAPSPLGRVGVGFSPTLWGGVGGGAAIPVVGASGMIYAMLGIWLALIATKKIRYKNYTFLYLFFIGITISAAFGLYRGTSAVALHFSCLTSAFLLYFLYQKINRKS